jgi:transposase
MSTRFKEVNRRSRYLFPESVEEWLPEDHLARFVVEIVDTLDIAHIENEYGGKGGISAYHPRMLLALIFYGYATGVFSSRKIEQATHDLVPFRYIAVNSHPDHDTISNFRKRFLDRLSPLFRQILVIANGMGCLQLGTISLDGTKIHANASKHSAYSYDYASALEERLQGEVEELLRLAEEADNEPLPDNLVIPEELSRRSKRIEAIRKAREEIERRAAERYEKELEEYREKQEARQAKEEETGKKSGGKDPKHPEGPAPRGKDQVNLTDEESRIMPISGGGFEQCYNAQAAVDVESHLIVISNVTQQTNDKGELRPALEAIERLPEGLPHPEKLLADAGYYSKDNLEACEEAKIEAYIPCRREFHYWDIKERFKPKGTNEAGEGSPSSRMKERMQTQEGRSIFAKRKCTIEPVFGVIKAVIGFRQFLFRGLSQVCNEWKLVCLAWNLKRLHKMTLRVRKGNLNLA